jgi:hypothetical protein
MNFLKGNVKLGSFFGSTFYFDCKKFFSYYFSIITASSGQGSIPAATKLSEK